jgi:hypothetical protein
MMRKCFHCNQPVAQGKLVWTFVMDTAHLPNQLVIHNDCFEVNLAIKYWHDTGNSLNQAPYQDSAISAVKQILDK